MDFPVPGGPINSTLWLANAGQTINGQRVIAGQGITITQTAHGIVISAPGDRQPNYTYNGGTFDFNAEYFPNAIVYDDPTKTFVDQNGVVHTGSGGSYICRNYVPPGGQDSVFFLNNVVPSYAAAGGSATDTEANNYRWYSQNIYYPVTTSFGTPTTVNVSGYNIVTSQSFWQPIAASAPASSSGGGAVNFAKITALHGNDDWFSASLWNGSSYANGVVVARQNLNRCSLGSYTFFGATYTYTYQGPNSRTTTFGSAQQSETLFPPIQVNDIIYVAQLQYPDTTVSSSISGSSVAPQWVDLTAREWAETTIT